MGRKPAGKGNKTPESNMKKALEKMAARQGKPYPPKEMGAKAAFLSQQTGISTEQIPQTIRRLTEVESVESGDGSSLRITFAQQS